ncbi:MAG: 5-(carboxyamino)imidazole ribonucleotide synthase [Acidimicrobiales bacterium]|nr:5-(carboxyamino)imidazole ribonucleotide synthase [Acidimicrobiales bacterium]
MADPLLPGSTIGIVGGGQLGRMLTQVAHQHGYRVVVFTGGEKDSPAGSVAEIEIAAPFDDETARARFLTEADVVTWEFENVDPGLADAALDAGLPVRPSGSVIAAAQDREKEKRALEAAGVVVAPWRPARTLGELREAVEALDGPVIAKAARFGYDGKGQVRIDSLDTVAAAWEQLEGARLVVETVVPFVRELSVIVARGVDGQIVDHGVMENDHVDHILDTTMVPASIPSSRADEARGLAHRIAEAWDLVGVLCVEIFDTDTALLVNEVAPRPHNSGHCTIEAAPASQFEQQLRAACALPLGDGACRPAAMVQLLGDLWSDGPPAWPAALADPGVHLHLYGKADARPGRKMGHLTCVGDTPTDALQKALDARHALSGR